MMPTEQALTILVLAISLGLDALSVAIGIGLRGLSGGRKVTVGASFAGFQVGMPVLGLIAGGILSLGFQDLVAYAGFASLSLLGLHMLWESRHGPAAETAGGLDLSRGWGLIAASISVSLDALGAGFSLVSIGVPILPALGAIGVAAFLMTFGGLHFGRFLGRRIEHRSGQAAGVLLTALGIFFAVRRVLLR